MTEKVQIEQLWKIKLSNLKPLIDASKELRDLPPEEKKIRAIVWSFSYSREYYAFTEHLAFKVRYHFKPRTHLGTGEEILEEAILFEWESPDGEQLQQDIELEYRESNLGKGYREYYFRDGAYQPCRVLYTDGRRLYSRDELRGRVVYKQQLQSRADRGITSYWRAEDILEEVRGRHLLWKGQLTPFAKKCLKAKEYIDTHRYDMEEALIPKKRGRKPKASKAPKPKSKNIAMY